MHKRFAIALLTLPFTAWAQSPVEYVVSFDNAVHHEARISVTWRDIGDEPLQMRMSRSSPGRYAIHEFAKNVYAVSVVDGKGNPLTFARPSPYQWDVAGHDGTVTVTYTLYADRAGGTYSGIDLTHAHLNAPATFMWARGFDDRPIRITFRPKDENWKVATQLPPTADPYVFTAPNLQYFMDSPTELSDFAERSWQACGASRRYR
jgi:predicted metalloprotease with PDZ domain